MARTPLPPNPVIPPEGLPMPAQATEATASPTTMILNYLQSRGFQPSTENVRRALEANAKDPGLIPGLRSDRPATEEEDQAAMRAAGAGGGRGGGGSTKSQPSGQGGPSQVMDRRDSGDNQTTSAQPAPATAASVAQSVLNPAGRAAMPDIPAPPETPRAAAVPGVPAPPEAPPMAASTMGAPVSGWPAGTEAWAQPNPMETAMQRAVGSVPEVPPVPNPVAGVQPVPPEIAARAAGGPATSVPPEVPGDMQFRRTGSGLQVQPNAMTRALPGAIAGAARGMKGGPLGALAGAAQGAAPDIIPYILKNLHLN